MQFACRQGVQLQLIGCRGIAHTHGGFDYGRADISFPHE